MSANELAGRSALVTGAAGFIGANLCLALKAAGARVIATSRAPPEGDGWRKLDLADPAAVEALVAEARPDFMFHLAAYVTGARGLEHVLPALQANCVNAVNVMTAAAKLPSVRVVLANSLEEPTEEEAGAAPVSPYAAAKLASTGYARMFHALYGLHVVPARIGMVYGPRQSDMVKLVPYTIRCLIEGEIPRFSSGVRLCDWIYVEDVADALIATALSDQAAGEVVDVATGTMTSVGDVVREIHALMDAPAPKFGDAGDRPLERTYRTDVARTRSLTGWRAAIDVREGLRRTVEWYRKELAKS
ncbi:MAG TPA: NAD-dependent epimerase/dehydratase family protein [Vitreimonas sp.]|nr:NAD-dependent epimerase/dehydratase family protein [Vitreimonas sp.]